MRYKKRALFEPSKAEIITPFDTLINQVMNDAFPQFNKSFGDDFFAKGAYPKVNVLDKKEAVVIEAAVPGLSGDDIDLELKEDLLTIRGRSNQAGHGDDEFVRREIKRSSFQRSFSLGQNLDSTKISASCSNGILIIRIPKIAEDKRPEEARKIKIK